MEERKPLEPPTEGHWGSCFRRGYTSHCAGLAPGEQRKARDRRKPPDISIIRRDYLKGRNAAFDEHLQRQRQKSPKLPSLSCFSPPLFSDSH